MSETAPDRPLSCRGDFAHPVTRLADDGSQKVTGGSLDRSRIVAADQAEEVLLVFPRLADRIR
jgi:hypothetical protein